MSDSATRSAARLALLIALPVALVTGFVVFRTLDGYGKAAAPVASATAADQTPVPMPSRSLSDSDATVCLAFVAHLPASVRGLAQRPVTDGQEQNAAYGQPPITLRCGGTPVPSVAPDALLWNLSGICWYADQSRPDVTVWTTLDRRVPIAVSVPSRYEGQGDWVQEFSNTILGWVPSLPHPPAKCQAPAIGPS